MTNPPSVMYSASAQMTVPATGMLLSPAYVWSDERLGSVSFEGIAVQGQAENTVGIIGLVLLLLIAILPG